MRSWILLNSNPKTQPNQTKPDQVKPSQCKFKYWRMNCHFQIYTKLKSNHSQIGRKTQKAATPTPTTATAAATACSHLKSVACVKVHTVASSVNSNRVFVIFKLYLIAKREHLIWLILSPMLHIKSNWIELNSNVLGSNSQKEWLLSEYALSIQ